VAESWAKATVAHGRRGQRGNHTVKTDCVRSNVLVQSAGGFRLEPIEGADSKASRLARSGINNIYCMRLNRACILTDRRIESVGLFLASFAGMKGISGTPDKKGKSLEKQKIAIS